MRAGAAVCTGTPPVLVLEVPEPPEVLVTAFWMDEIKELAPPVIDDSAPERTLDAEERASAAEEETDERAPEAEDESDEAAPDAEVRAPDASDATLLAPAPTAPKTVVDPIIEVKTEPPSVTKD